MIIENFKGFEITLDTQTGKFVGDGATHRNGKEFESTSLKALRTKINGFIKENQNFGTFKVRPKFESNWDIKKLKLITTVKGVTANRKLTVEKPDGKTGTIGKYDINRYVIFNEEDNEIIDKCLKISEEISKASKMADQKIRNLMNTTNEKPLYEFLQEAGIEVDMNERGY